MRAKHDEIPSHGDVRLARLLRRRIVDVLALEILAGRAHWEVKGPNHIALHGLFDQIYANMDTHVVELAAVVEELGGTVPGSAALRARSHLLAPDTEDGSTGHGQVAELADRLGEFSRSLHRLQLKVARLGSDHASVACVGLMHDVDKYRQMLNIHLHPRH